MTEQTGFPPGAQQVVDEQLAAGLGPPSADAGQEPVAAGLGLSPEQAAAQAPRADPDVEAKAAADLAAGKRGPLLPAEEQMDQIMAALKAQSDQIEVLTAQLTAQQKQLAQANAASGGPLLTRYADAFADTIAMHAVANPDLGTVRKDSDGKLVIAGHFGRPYELAARLRDTAAAAVDSGKPDDVRGVVTSLERWLSRTHPRAGKHVDLGTALQYLEYVADEADKLDADKAA